MARPVSEEELQLKKRARRRLIGAIVLVCVVAVVLPMVLDSEPKRTSQEISIQIPSPDSKGFVSKVVPLTPAAKGDKHDKHDKGDKAEAKSGAPAPADALPGTEMPPAKIEASAVKAESPRPPAPKESARAEGGNFFVQIIALADADKAKQVQQQIIDAGVRSYTEVVVAGKGSVTRVRAGPFASREEADAAQKKLLAAGLEGKVGNR